MLGKRKNNTKLIEKNNKKQGDLLVKMLRSSSTDSKIKKNIEEDPCEEQKNVKFYLNQIKSVPEGNFIDIIHEKWYGEYFQLEHHHGYIQWLFPNFYTSRFNEDSYPLTFKEANMFRETPKIAERLIKSYQLIYDFYGFTISDLKTGKITRNENYLERYNKTLITSPHNHLRITRILAHMNIVGFRKYAIELVDFLEIEIYGSLGGYKDYINKLESKTLTIDDRKKLRNNPLSDLIRNNIFSRWKIYGKFINEIIDKKELYKICFCDDENIYKDSIYFTKISQN